MSDRQNVCWFASLGTWWCLTNAVIGVQWQTWDIFAHVTWSTYKLTRPSIPSVCWHHSDIRTYQVIQTNVTSYWLLSMHVAYVAHSFCWLQWDVDVRHPPPPPPSLPWSARTVGASHESPPVVSVQSSSLLPGRLDLTTSECRRSITVQVVLVVFHLPPSRTPMTSAVGRPTFCTYGLTTGC